MNKLVFSLDLKKRKGRRISEIGWQRVSDRRCKKAERRFPVRCDVALWDFEEMVGLGKITS